MEAPQIQTPTLPWASNPRRDRPPSLPGPSFSRSAFAADADAGATPSPSLASNPSWDRPSPLLSPSYSRRALTATDTAPAGDGDATEYPCVMLLEWWLDSMEGDDQKIAVGGLFERNQSVEELSPTAIAKRHGLCALETEDGIVLLINGTLDMVRTHENGYTVEVCEKFQNGFPDWWQSCNQRYPKVTSSSCTRNSEVDTTQFYLKQFQLGERIIACESYWLSKLGGSVNSSSQNDAAFQKSSYLPNGAPRFEEYTCDGDIIATNENVSASNDGGERHEAVCNEVDNVEMQLTAGKTLRERDDGDIDTNASLVLTVEGANDAANEEANNAPPSSTFEECCDIPTNGKAAALNSDSESYAALSKEVDNVEIEFTAGSVLCESGHGDIDTNASLAFTSECADDVGNEESGNAPPTSTCDQRTPVVSLKTQGWEKTQHVALSNKAAVDGEMLTSGCSDMQKSPYLSNEIPRCEESSYIGDIPTNEDGAASKDNSERCTAVSEEVHSMEIGLIVGSTIRERGHDEITNVSLAPTVECSDDAVNEGIDNASLLGCKKTPVASLNRQGCHEKHQHIPSNEKASGPPKKQRSALEKLQGATRPSFTSPVPHASGPPKKQRSALEKMQGATRSPLTNPVSYAHESPLTRGRATSLSMSIPEALKLRKTRSGRVVVPTLDAGCQRIVYDMDGTITGVIGLDLLPPKASKLKTYSRKRRAEPAAGGSKMKTYARKKRRTE